MNHELVHVVSMEQAASVDERYRRFFGGKVETDADHPETILYNYLATPRNNSPRWYMEGSATFMETWMSGGIGRAQGAPLKVGVLLPRSGAQAGIGQADRHGLHPRRVHGRAGAVRERQREGGGAAGIEHPGYSQSRLRPGLLFRW